VQRGGEPRLHHLFSVVWLSWGQRIEVESMDVRHYWKGIRRSRPLASLRATRNEFEGRTINIRNMIARATPAMDEQVTETVMADDSPHIMILSEAWTICRRHSSTDHCKRCKRFISLRAADQKLERGAVTVLTQIPGHQIIVRIRKLRYANLVLLLEWAAVPSAYCHLRSIDVPRGTNCMVQE